MHTQTTPRWPRDAVGWLNFLMEWFFFPFVVFCLLSLMTAISVVNLWSSTISCTGGNSFCQKEKIHTHQVEKKLGHEVIFYLRETGNRGSCKGWIGPTAFIWVIYITPWQSDFLHNLKNDTARGDFSLNEMTQHCKTSVLLVWQDTWRNCTEVRERQSLEPAGCSFMGGAWALSSPVSGSPTGVYRQTSDQASLFSSHHSPRIIGNKRLLPCCLAARIDRCHINHLFQLKASSKISGFRRQWCSCAVQVCDIGKTCFCVIGGGDFLNGCRHAGCQQSVHPHETHPNRREDVMTNR